MLFITVCSAIPYAAFRTFIFSGLLFAYITYASLLRHSINIIIEGKQLILYRFYPNFVLSCNKQRENYKLKMHSIKKQKKQPKSTSLFNTLSFLLLTDNLPKRDIEHISIQVLQHGGSLETVECGADPGRKITADYLLCDPRLDANQIRQTLPQSVKYKEAIDFSYIQTCLSADKLVPANSFRLRVKSKEIQPIKKTKIEKVEQKPQNKQKSQPKKEQKKLKDITKVSNNKLIIDQLNKLLKVYSNEGDRGRKIAYSRAISSIKSLDYELQTDQDVQRLKTSAKHIGDKIVDKIKQLLKTGSIHKLEALKNTEQNIALQQITRVWGIGAAKAKQMYQRGIRTLQDLKKQVQKHPEILTKNQKIGLKYVDDLQIRIPRKKVTLMSQIVRQTLFEIVGSKDLHEVEVCGSYRRGKETCGDMDIFITRKDGQYEKMLLTKLVEKLSQKDFLTEHLTMPRHLDNKGCQSYMGICHYKDELHHRIDIKYYPIEEFAFAVLYFTGSDMFNRKMRLEAIEKGYHLSDHGMHKVIKNGKNQEKGAPIKCKTEKQIFQVLDIEYKQPVDRDA